MNAAERKRALRAAFDSTERAHNAISVADGSVHSTEYGPIDGRDAEESRYIEVTWKLLAQAHELLDLLHSAQERGESERALRKLRALLPASVAEKYLKHGS